MRLTILTNARAAPPLRKEGDNDEIDLQKGAGIFSQRSYESCRPRVVAVVSAMTTRMDGQPASTLGVRMSRFADFLRAGAETAARFGNYEKPEWADD